LLWKNPGFREEIVVFGEPFAHSGQVLCHIVFLTDVENSWKLRDLLERLHADESIRRYTVVVPHYIPAITKFFICYIPAQLPLNHFPDYRVLGIR
jgi:hypothetical protein